MKQLWKKGYLQNFSLGIVSVIILFGIMEVAARVANSKILGSWLNSVDSRTKLEQAYIPPFPEKSGDTLRVFVYGGSTVQGLPFPKVGFVSMLDYQIRHVFQERRAVEIYNFGWSGYNTTVVRSILAKTIVEKPDLILIYSAHNEFLYPQLDWYPLLRGITIFKNRSALGKILVTLRESRRESGVSFGKKFDRQWPAFTTQRLYYDLKQLFFRQNLRAMVGAAEKAGVPIVFFTGVSNIADWPPVKRETTTLPATTGYQEAIESVKSLIKSGSWVEANNAVDQALNDYPLDPPLLFLKAQILTETDWNRARQIFVQAKNLDYIPWRASSKQNDFIRSLADGERVWVADAEKEFFKQSANGLPGFSLVADDVHPTVEGNYLIVNTLIDLLKTDKLVKADWWQETWDPYDLEDLLERVNYSQNDVFESLYKTAKYSLKNPFLHFDVVRAYLDQAEEVNSRDWRTKALRATVEYMDGDKSIADKLVLEADRLHGARLTAADIEDMPYLEQFWER